MEKAKYQLIILKNNSCIETISNHINLRRIIAKYNKLLTENKKIIFPVCFLNEEKVEPVKYHLAIIKRKEVTDEIPKLKNDYGQFVDHVIEDNDSWVMYDKHEYNYEESFWLYGYHPRFHRKDFMFIYNEIVKKYGTDKYNFLNICIYKNKILFETSNHMDMVICKNQDDAVRLYSLLDEYAIKDKLKYIMFSGDNGKTRKNAKNVVSKISKLTNWNKKKIYRNTT